MPIAISINSQLDISEFGRTTVESAELSILKAPLYAAGLERSQLDSLVGRNSAALTCYTVF